MQQAGQLSQDGYWRWDGAQWVPNLQRPYAAARPVVAPYESAAFRAMMITIFLAANIVGVVLFAAFDILEIIHLKAGSPNDSLFFAEGMVAILAALSYFGTFIPAVVFFAMWVHRVVRNMPVLGSPDPRWTPRGAVIRCFLPFLNLLHPLYSVLDAWRGSWSGRRWVDLNARKALSAPFVISAWWATWLIARFGSWFAAVVQRNNDIQIQVGSLAFDILSQFVLVLSTILAIAVVRHVTARQDLKDGLIESGKLV